MRKKRIGLTILLIIDCAYIVTMITIGIRENLIIPSFIPIVYPIIFSFILVLTIRELRAREKGLPSILNPKKDH